MDTYRLPAPFLEERKKLNSQGVSRGRNRNKNHLSKISDSRDMDFEQSDMNSKN